MKDVCPDISIIIPVYQAELFLEKCINSIVAQSYENWELLLINDGSTDRSGELCNQFSNIDNRISVIHKENGGVSSARNLGIDLANGKYIMFVDSDDWISADYCESYMEMIDMWPSAQIIVGGYTIFNERGVVPKLNSYSAVLSLSEVKENFRDLFNKNLLNSPCAKLYRRDLIDSVRFREDMSLGEDLDFNLRYLLKCEDIVIVPLVSYFYNCTNEFAATKRYRLSNYNDCLLQYRIVKEFTETLVPYVRNFMEEAMSLMVINQLQLVYYSELENKKEVALEWINNDVIRKCFANNYRFRVIDKIPFILIKIKSEFLLAVFYRLKRILKSISKSRLSR